MDTTTATTTATTHRRARCNKCKRLIDLAALDGVSRPTIRTARTARMVVANGPCPRCGYGFWGDGDRHPAAPAPADCTCPACHRARARGTRGTHFAAWVQRNTYTMVEVTGTLGARRCNDACWGSAKLDCTCECAGVNHGVMNRP